MVLYPLATLKASGIDEIMVVCGKEHASDFMGFGVGQRTWRDDLVRAARRK